MPDGLLFLLHIFIFIPSYFIYDDPFIDKRIEPFTTKIILSYVG
jgi:uncharacterized membrane protein